MTLISLGGSPIPFPPIMNNVSYITVTVDAADEYGAQVIQIPKTGTLKKIGFRTGTVTTADTINVRIETVDDTTGYPTNTLYATGATGSQTSPASSTMYWVEINSTTGISVTKGDIVAVKYLLDFVDGNMTLSMGASGLGTSTSNTNQFPYIVTYTGSTTKVQAGAVVLALEYTDEIVPFASGICIQSATTSSFNNTSDPDHRGLKFTVPIGIRVVGFWA